jgi:flagellar protein FliS
LIGELAGALDMERGGEIAVRLGRLYEYMLNRLTEANFRQSDEPLAEVLGLLATLTEAWDGIEVQKSAPCEANPRWTPPPVEYAGAQAWSF